MASSIDFEKYPPSADQLAALREFAAVVARVPAWQLSIRYWHTSGRVDPPDDLTITCACNWYAASPEGRARGLIANRDSGPRLERNGQTHHAEHALFRATDVEPGLWLWLLDPFTVEAGQAYQAEVALRALGERHPNYELSGEIVLARLAAYFAAHGHSLGGRRRVLSSR